MSLDEGTPVLDRVSRGELERRWREVREAMAEQRLDALVIQSANDWLGGVVKYFTDIPAK